MNDIVTQPPVEQGPDFSHLVAGKTPADVIGLYVQLRDGKKQAEETYSAWQNANFVAPMTFLEGWLLNKLNELGVDSLAGPEGTGTAYKIKTVSVTIADQREFRRHVIGSEQWDLADWRANKTAVEDWVAEGKGLPPGVNYTSFIKVGIRRK